MIYLGNFWWYDCLKMGQIIETHMPPSKWGEHRVIWISNLLIPILSVAGIHLHIFDSISRCNVTCLEIKLGFRALPKGFSIFCCFGVEMRNISPSSSKSDVIFLDLGRDLPVRGRFLAPLLPALDLDLDLHLHLVRQLTRTNHCHFPTFYEQQLLDLRLISCKTYSDPST